MKILYIIGLTGGIACGKSSIAYIFRNSFGATILDIDNVTNQLLQPGGELFELYLRHFGKNVVTEEGKLNRKIVAEIIFNHPDEREWINSVSHPLLLNYARDFLVECAENGIMLVVMEVPLLFEAGWESLFDEIWAIYATPAVQLWRLMNRDKLTEEQALKRIAAQMSAEEICSRADIAIKSTNKSKSVRRKVFNAMRGRKFC